MKDNKHMGLGKLSPSWAIFTSVQRYTEATGGRALLPKCFRHQELLNVDTFNPQSVSSLHPPHPDPQTARTAVCGVSLGARALTLLPQRKSQHRVSFSASHFSLPKPLAYLRNHGKFGKNDISKLGFLSPVVHICICIWLLCWSSTILILLQQILLANYSLQTSSAYPLALSPLLGAVTHLLIFARTLGSVSTWHYFLEVSLTIRHFIRFFNIFCILLL